MNSDEAQEPKSHKPCQRSGLPCTAFNLKSWSFCLIVINSEYLPFIQESFRPNPSKLILDVRLVPETVLSTFPCVIYLVLQNTLMSQVLLVSSFHKWRDWGMGELCTDSVTGKAGLWIQFSSGAWKLSKWCYVSLPPTDPHLLKSL